jgi:flavin-dependent dehydrogenase
VARYLRGGRDHVQAVVAREAEVRLDESEARIEGDAPELYFSRDLEGYAWCVRKGDYVNVGIGRRDGRDFNAHLRAFADFLERAGIVRHASRLPFQGHAYLAAGVGPRPLAGPGMLVVGDSGGFAYPESGEGIKPAIQSGRWAAEMLIGSEPADAADRYVRAVTSAYPRVRTYPPLIRPVATATGRQLMRSRAFARNVLLNRWFLRLSLPA